MSLPSFMKGILALSVAGVLSGCAAVPVLMATAVGTTAAVSTDRRTFGAQVADSTMEKRITVEIQEKIKEGMHLTVTSYNRWVLLTGEVNTQTKKEIAGEVARKSLEVNRVFNELAVMEPVEFSQRFSDSTLATKIRTSIIATSDVYLNQIKITVDRGNVYIMGMVTQSEADILVDKISHTSGVKSVVKAFEVLSKSEIEKRMKFIKGVDVQQNDGSAGKESASSEVWLN